MDAILHIKQAQIRTCALMIGAVILSVLVLGLAPLLLSGTTAKTSGLLMEKAKLIPITPEEIIASRELPKEKPPEPPPELKEPEAKEPEIKEPELPEMEMPDMSPPEPAIEPMKADVIPETFMASPALNALPVTSLPLQSSALNLKVNLTLTKAAMPRVAGKLQLPVKDHGIKTSYNMDEVDRTPEGVLTMQPVYPYRARRMTIEGYVQVKFLVDKNGETRDLTIMRSEPVGVFEKTVEKTLSRWKFKPGVKDGKPVATWVMTTIKFKLENDS